MKKASIFLFALVMVMTFTLTAFATNGGFVGSPSGDSAPVLDSYENEHDDCTIEVDVVPYADRADLDNEGRDAIEEAYQQIMNMTDGSVLAEAFKQVAAQSGINAEKLAVSDLFTMVFDNCDGHDAHGITTITLTTETIQHFAGLLTFEDGKWGVVAGDKYSIQGNKITFEGTAVDAYVVLVDTSKMESSPVTANGGDDTVSPLWIALMAVSALGLIIVAVLYTRVRKAA